MGWCRERLLFTAVFVCLVSAFASGSVEAGPQLKLDLDKCVEMALEVNVSALKAGYDLDVAKNGVITSASTLLPTLGLYSQNSEYELADGRQVGDKIVNTAKAYNGGLTLGETVSMPGFMGVLESLADRRATGHYVILVNQDVSYIAKQKYLVVLRTRRLLEVAQEALDLSMKRLEKAQAMVEVGSAVRSDVLRAEVERSSNQLDLISAENDVRLAETDLRHFLAVDDEVELDLEDVPEPGELSYSLDEALTEAFRSRADIKQANATLSASSHAVWRERGAWFPYLGFDYSNSYTGEGMPEKLADIHRKASWSWHFTVGIDLFDGFQTFGRVRQAKARRNSAREDLLQTKRDAAFEVREAFYSLEEARQRVEVSRRTVEVAEEELRLSEERYRLGAGTMLEQIDSQVSLSEARTSHIEALYDLLLSQARLVRAMGRV
jgi:outer membrane protein